MSYLRQILAALAATVLRLSGSRKAFVLGLAAALEAALLLAPLPLEPDCRKQLALALAGLVGPYLIAQGVADAGQGGASALPTDPLRPPGGPTP